MIPISLNTWKKMALTFSHKGFEFKYWRTNTFDQSKKTLLLIHGYPSSSWDWSKIWKSLENDFNLVAIDMLGFGLSDKPVNITYSIAFQADLQEAILNHLSVSKFAILAHDYGDTVAQEMLARDSGKKNIEHAFLLNGGLFPETHKALMIQKLMLSKFGFLIKFLIGKSAFIKSFNKVCARKLSAVELDNIWELLNHNNGKGVLHMLINYMNERKVFRERWVGILNETQTPITLINGSSDPISGSNMVVRYKELVSSNRVYPLDGVGHYPQLEAPDRVLEIISNFVSSAVAHE